MDIRQQLLAAFEAEHREHIDAIRAGLAGGREGRPPDWNDIFRRAHSLKGAARAVDLPPVEAVAHRLEALFERVLAGNSLDRAGEAATQLALDRIEAFVAALKGEASPGMPGDAVAALDACLSGAPVAREPAPASPKPPAAAQPAAPFPPSEPSSDPASALLRVPADAVEALTRATHDLASTLGGEALVADGLARIVRAAADLRRRAEAVRGRGALGALARGLSASAADPAHAAVDAVRADLRGLEAALDGLLREATDLARRQAGIAGAIEGASARVRAEADRLALVPAETVFGGFARFLREAAREQGREIDVTERGLDLPVDRAMLQALKDPVLHALRNALSHGAETPEARRRAGKPPALGIVFEVGVRGGRLSIAIHDDGHGPDLAAIAATARRRGLLAEGDAEDADGLLALVFEPGFSTARSVDALAGRGFGLSVVADAVRALRGSVRLEPRAPSGASLTMSLPLSAARRAMLLAEAGGATYALPGAAVSRLLRIDRADLGQAMGRAVVRLPGPEGTETALPVFTLAELVGTAEGAAQEGPVTVVLVRGVGGGCAVAVDRLHDVRTLLVLPAPPIGADTGLVAGTVILTGDRPALVIDPEALVARAGAAQFGPAPVALAAGRPGHGTLPASPRSTILVVDDSITTRTLEKGILEAAGYRVVVCVDGQDALDRLRAEVEPVSLVLADVEMPRLDGFGLLSALRADARFARLPIILMTSRGDAEDVARGLELGADAYLTKQKFDQRALLDTIGQLL